MPPRPHQVHPILLEDHKSISSRSHVRSLGLSRLRSQPHRGLLARLIPIPMLTVLRITLAIGAQQIAEPVEEFAVITIICSDKPCTMATNKPTSICNTTCTYGLMPQVSVLSHLWSSSLIVVDLLAKPVGPDPVLASHMSHTLL
ncbi:hypothetical protein LXA43DRAFT_1102003 [Ganoderma leucocontextum]|nr:hypothetical protein LXA43DRAFT_1102003 [Ganoderma leucocontextum]